MLFEMRQYTHSSWKISDCCISLAVWICLSTDELRKQVCSDFPNCVFSTLSLPSTPTLKVDSTPSDVSVDTHSSHIVQKSKGHCTSCGAIATSCDSDRLQNQCTDDRSVHSDGPQDETKQINEKERNEGGLCEKLDRTSIVSYSGCTQRQHVASDGSKEGEKSDSKVQLETADSAKLRAEQSTSQQVPHFYPLCVVSFSNKFI